MVGGMFYAVKRREEQDLLLLSATLPGVLFFTLVAKKQVYYTFPMLVAVGVVGWTVSKLSWLGLGCGVCIVDATRCGIDLV